MFSKYCSISSLSCSFEFVWVVGCGGGGWWWCSQRLLSLNPTTVMVILFLGLWLLMACDNFVFEGPKYEFRRPALHFIPPTRIKNCRAVYSYLLAPLKGEGGKNRRKMSQKEGKNIIVSILPHIMTFAIEFMGYFMTFPHNFVFAEYYHEYYL